MKYYKEIDGLRALAVSLVILFHLKLAFFAGGYIGVDVFFVISGFLITSIIIKELSEKKFSLKQFYLKRLLRLGPALLVTVVGSLLVCMIIMSPSDLIYAARQAIVTVLSVSNIFYWSEAGYWDSSSFSKIFLHTWSLGVEEQFYLVYPILLMVTHKFFGKNGVLLFLLLSTAVGLYFSEVYTQHSPSTAFYLSPFRFFQFSIGGLAYFLVNWKLFNLPNGLRILTLLLGLSGIVWCGLVFSEETSFPGVAALPVSIATILVIISGSTSISRILLANQVSIWLGKASYSLYLVHWPIIVIYQYQFGPNFSVIDMLIMTSATLLLGGIINKYVENRFRIGSTTDSQQTPWRFAYSNLVVIFVFVLSFLIIEGKGWAWRLPDSITYLAERKVEDSWKDVSSYMHSKLGRRQGPFFGKRSNEKDNILILADSRGKDLFVAFDKAYENKNIYVSTNPGCPPVIDKKVADSKRAPNCSSLNEEVFNYVDTLPPGETIVLGMDLTEYRIKAVIKTASSLVSKGHKVIVIGQTRFIDGMDPLALAVKHGRVVNEHLAIDDYLVDEPFSIDYEYNKAFSEIGAIYIPNEAFFKAELGYRIFTKDKKDLVIYDKFHLTLPGATEYAAYLKSYL